MSYLTLYTDQTLPEPVVAADLRAELQTNTTDEDALLSNYITSARQKFEYISGRTLGQKTYRQFFFRMPYILYLKAAPVNAITAVKLRDANNAWVDATSYITNTDTIPANISFVQGAINYTYASPVCYVEYTAGYTANNLIPADITVAIKRYAAHLFLVRSTYQDRGLRAVPMGFQDTARQYGVGLQMYGDEDESNGLHFHGYYPYSGWRYLP